MRQESDRLWCVNLAPATGGNAMSCEYIAARRRIPRLAQVLRAGAAFLSGLVGGVGRRVHLGGIVHESQRFGRGIVRVQRGERRRARSAADQTKRRNQGAGDEAALDNRSTCHL